MIEDIRKVQKTPKPHYHFSVLVPTWNNLEFLKVCLNSISKNSRLDIQVIVIVNEGRDGTEKWLETQDSVDYVLSKTNIGICYGLNSTRSLIKSDYVVYVNDDMYLLPGWDVELWNEIGRIQSKSFMLSCTMIEPTDTGNPCVIVRNYGQDIQSFREKDLLEEFKGLSVPDWSGSTWPPNVVHIDAWDLVGGLSVEFSPGMYSDPDFSKKLFDAGVRFFKGKGNSLVYHFGSRSTRRVKKNKGRSMFLLKWGFSSKTFTRSYLRIGKPFAGEISQPESDWKTSLVNRLKRMRSAWEKQSRS
jgi:glycosyltransferase involved in cell wall biosynthesis